MSTKEVQDQIVDNMKRWQKVENASVASTGQVIEQTENPIVRMVMEIIQHDSQTHYRIQQFIIDSLTTSTVALTPEELGDVWGMIEKHIEIEDATIRLAKEATEALKGTKMSVQQYLLGYLLEDEQKHSHMLEALSAVKGGMYPYS